MLVKGTLKATLDNLPNGKKFEITREGFLKTRAKVTRIGIFDYFEGEDKFRRLRQAKEVFDKQSMDSLSLKPITNLHPEKAFVDSENIKQFQVGSVGEIIEQDGKHVICTVLITDKGMVQEIQDRFEGGESIEVSCGYYTHVKDAAGVHPEFGTYDQVQTQIRYNHLAIVDAGRAGPSARLLLDQNNQKEKTMLIPYRKEPAKLGSFSMDAITGSIHQESSSVVDRLSGKLDESLTALQVSIDQTAAEKKKHDEAKAQADQKDEKIKELQAQVDNLGDINSEVFQKRLANAEQMRDVAKTLKVDTKDGEGKAKDSKTLMVDIIAKKCKDGKFNPEGQSDDYIRGRYSTIVEDVLSGEPQRDAEETELGDLLADAATEPEGEELSPKDRFVSRTKDMAALPTEKAN